jgi:hypothetical protein
MIGILYNIPRMLKSINSSAPLFPAEFNSLPGFNILGIQGHLAGLMSAPHQRIPTYL